MFTCALPGKEKLRWVSKFVSQEQVGPMTGFLAGPPCQSVSILPTFASERSLQGPQTLLGCFLFPAIPPTLNGYINVCKLYGKGELIFLSIAQTAKDSKLSKIFDIQNKTYNKYIIQESLRDMGKMDKVVHAYNPSRQEVEAKEL